MLAVLACSVSSPVETVVESALINWHLVFPEVDLILDEAVDHGQTSHCGEHLKTLIRGERGKQRCYPTQIQAVTTALRSSLVLFLFFRL